jgi:polar amino acid transport system permease protein
MRLDFTDIYVNWEPFLTGAWMTLVVSLVSIGLGVLGGLVLCFFVMSKSVFLRKFGNVYTSFFRGTPLLVQLLLAFYLLPALIGIDIPPKVAAIGALAMNTTAFQAEIYRGGFLALSPGQFEAARILGISPWQARRVILIPQMMRLVLPALTNETISIVKGSSLVSIVAVTELMRVSEEIAAVHFRATEAYLAAAIMYFVMNYFLAWSSKLLEHHLGRYV